MTYFFIGGPWNNRLVDFDRDVSCWRVPVPRETTFELPPPGATIANEIVETVDYYLDAPLPTGVPVLSAFFWLDSYGYRREAL